DSSSEGIHPRATRASPACQVSHGLASSRRVGLPLTTVVRARPRNFRRIGLAHRLLSAPTMKKTVPSLLFVVLASSGACTVAGDPEDEVVDEGEVTLANPDDAGKADTAFGKALRYVVRDEWAWTA